MGRINQLFRERPAITSPTHPAHAAGRTRAGARWSSEASGSATPARGSAGGCCRTSPSRSRPAARWPSSARPDRASPRWWTCWSAPTTRPRARAHRRRGRPAAGARRAPSGRRLRAAGDLPLQRDAARERPARRPGRRSARAGGRGGQLAEALPALPNGLRHHAGRAGHQPLRRAEAAHARSRARWRRTRRSSCSTTP